MTLFELSIRAARDGVNIHAEPPSGGTKWRKKDYVTAIAEKYLENTPEKQSWGVYMRMCIDPMLAFSSWGLLSPGERSAISGDSKWVAQEKFSGVRVIVCCHPETGITVWGRHHTETTFLPEEYTERALFVGRNGLVQSWGDVKVPRAVIFDGELFFENPPDIGFPYDPRSYLSPTEIALGLPPERCLLYQRSTPLSFAMFDCLYYDTDWIIGKPLSERIKTTVKALGENPNLPFHCPSVSGDLDQTFQKMDSDHKEGIIIKHLDSPYLFGKRDKRAWIKRKCLRKDPG